MREGGGERSAFLSLADGALAPPPSPPTPPFSPPPGPLSLPLPRSAQPPWSARACEDHDRAGPNARLGARRSGPRRAGEGEIRGRAEGPPSPSPPPPALSLLSPLHARAVARPTARTRAIDRYRAGRSQLRDPGFLPGADDDGRAARADGRGDLARPRSGRGLERGGSAGEGGHLFKRLCVCVCDGRSDSGPRR